MNELDPQGLDKPVLLIGGLAVSLVAYAVGNAVYRIWLHPLSKIPGPKHLAVSDVMTLYNSHVNMGMSEQAVQLHRKYGPIVRVGPNRLIIDGSIAWSQVYNVRSTTDNDEFAKIPGYVIPDDHLALIAANRTTHRRQRRQLAHAFSAAAMLEQEHIIRSYIDKLLNIVESHAHKQEPIDIVSYLNYTVFDVIGDLTFAESFGSLDGDTTFVDNIFRGLKGQSLTTLLTMLPWMKIPLMLLLGSKELRIAQEAGVTNEQLGIDKARSRLAMEKQFQVSGRRDIATYMLRPGKDGEDVLNPTEVMLNSSLIITAGSETTATGLAGLLFLLSRTENASKLQRLVDVLTSSFSSESEITMTSTAQVEYLAAVIEEGLRMYPPAASLPPRQSPGAEVGGNWLPKGTILHFHSKATHRNPDYFRDPDSFVPERWLKASHPLHLSRYESDRKEVFKPFSVGSRDCIGKNLAYAEMRTVLARFVFRFDYEVLPGQDNWMSKQGTLPILWLKDGLRIQPTLRKHAVAEK
ncbi:aspirochlorine biosynthesis cytochrome P450 monooxygenase [Microdochium nivale]|nr:aspirochlorine biosynthesis cytochrome P450 monooxygenase [Microdochium nivale]